MKCDGAAASLEQIGKVILAYMLLGLGSITWYPSALGRAKEWRPPASIEQQLFSLSSFSIFPPLFWARRLTVGGYLWKAMGHQSSRDALT
jgi:hypothetical protein